MKKLKYEYFLCTWGGFYNEQNRNMHKEKEGNKYFDTAEERDKYLDMLKRTAKSLPTEDSTLMSVTKEGYHVRDLPVCHRIVEYKGRRFYSCKKWDWPEDLRVLLYSMEYKWTPGFNDDIVEEVLGEDVDYEQVKIIQEWVTGAFDKGEND